MHQDRQALIASWLNREVEPQISLSDLSSQELYDLDDQLRKKYSESFRERARARGQQKSQGPAGDEADKVYVDRRREVREEIGKRVQQGDPKLDAIAAGNLENGMRVLGGRNLIGRSLVDQMFGSDPVSNPLLSPTERVATMDGQEQAADAAKKEPIRNTSSPTVELTDRKKKIWEVIQCGSKGRQYCRELDNAGIVPPRNGVWRDGPRKYVAAYELGVPWRHRIEDEKAKIRRKGKKLAGALAGE